MTVDESVLVARKEKVKQGVSGKGTCHSEEGAPRLSSHTAVWQTDM